jgi:hypothetical protein
MPENLIPCPSCHRELFHTAACAVNPSGEITESEREAWRQANLKRTIELAQARGEC